MKPKHYSVQYSVAAKHLYEGKETDSLDEARYLIRNGGVIHKRINVVDVTPEGDPPGLLWDWEDEYLEDK